jgi:steroid 5-alpha reductase family enzyme
MSRPIFLLWFIHMSDKRQDSIAGIAAAVVIGALVAWAGSDGSALVGSIPVFALCGGLAFVINWLVFIPSSAAKTEKYYDLTGSITYLTVTVVALALSGDLDARAVIAGAMVIVWTVRLGTFLFLRINRDGRDGRFDEIKTNPTRFLMAWTIQGLWVLLTASAALAIITTTDRRVLGWVAYLGIAVWLGGFAIEAVADRQKSAFKADPANEGRYISTGLWAWSRHPNYFGEITLWTGVAILAVPILSGWQWIVLISPVFVTVLLTRVSGIPMLEARADKRWGGQDDYQAYKDSTPVLIPKRPTRP